MRHCRGNPPNLRKRKTSSPFGNARPEGHLATIVLMLVARQVTRGATEGNIFYKDSTLSQAAIH